MLIKDQFGIIQMSPISQTSFLVGDFFCRFLQQTGSSTDSPEGFQRQLPLGCKSVTCCYWH